MSCIIPPGESRNAYGWSIRDLPKHFVFKDVLIENKTSAQLTVGVFVDPEGVLRFEVQEISPPVMVGDEQAGMAGRG